MHTSHLPTVTHALSREEQIQGIDTFYLQETFHFGSESLKLHVYFLLTTFDAHRIVRIEIYYWPYLIVL
ncbi:hypothetical protein D3C80_1764090 [compost metagenome]